MLIVKKFGGTSVADKEKIYNVANRCIEDLNKRKSDSFSSLCDGETNR